MIRHLCFLSFLCVAGCAARQHVRHFRLEVLSLDNSAVVEICRYDEPSQALARQKEGTLNDTLDWLNSECPSSGMIDIEMQKGAALFWPDSRKEIGPFVVSRLKSSLVPQILIWWATSNYDSPIFAIDKQSGKLLLKGRGDLEDFR